MSTVRYFPILKSKTGERLALEWLRGRVRAGITPVWELVVPAGPKPDVGAFVRGQAFELAEVWSGGRILVDGALLGPDEAAAGALREFFQLARGRLQAVPVYSAKLGAAARAAVTSAAASGGCGLAVRVRPADFRASPGLAVMLETACREAGVGPAQTDLIVDLGAIAQALPDEAVDQTAAAIARIPYLQQWRSFAVASGAFPQNLTRYEPGIHRIARHDWDLWLRLCAPGMLPRRPDYSDYGVHHPELPPQIPGRAGSPSLRFTAPHQFVAVRGRRKAGQTARPEQFRERCRELLKENGLVDRFFSEGDERIVRCAGGTLSNGAQSHWRGVSTEHHLTQVWDQLASLAAGGE